MYFIPWKVPKNDEIPVEIIEQMQLPDFLARFLAGRGIVNREKMRDLLEATVVWHDPALLADIEPAVVRIKRAIEDRERILIYGDYDCDGITSTVMLYDYLENAGADVLYYIPEREGEGYGLNMSTITNISDAGVNLVITVDNGISACHEIEWLSERNIDVIVTDHHQPPEILPSCIAVINPHRSDCKYPFKDLCGAGVTFKLISALECDNEGMLIELYGDLLAIATMADIVPLYDENRSFVRQGLEVLKNTQREGIAALLQVAGINTEETSLTSEQISFGLAPRINVTGRIASVDMAVELLLSQDFDEAEKIAQEINRLNTRRKDIEACIIGDIIDYLHAHPKEVNDRVLVVKGKNWHTGVIGITAARLVERYRKPVIVFSEMENGELRGSARSVEGYSIIKAISACSSLLQKFGGHPMAAGLSLNKKDYDNFKIALEAYNRENYPIMPYSSLAVDADITIQDITIQNIRLLSRLQPFGAENPQPIPVLRGVELTTINSIGNGNHLRITLSDGVQTIDAVYFGMQQQNFPISKGTKVDVAVALSINNYKGNEKPSVRIVSMAPCGFDAHKKAFYIESYQRLQRGEVLDDDHREDYLFGRDELSSVFKFLRKYSPYMGGIDWMAYSLQTEINFFCVLIACDILTELGLVTQTIEDGATTYTVVPTSSKANIATAPTYMALQKLSLTKQ